MHKESHTHVTWCNHLHRLCKQLQVPPPLYQALPMPMITSSFCSSMRKWLLKRYCGNANLQWSKHTEHACTLAGRATDYKVLKLLLWQMLMCEDLSFFSCKWLVIQYIIRCYFCLSTSANNCRFPNKKWNLQLIRYWMKWILQESLVRTKKPQPHWKKKKIVYEVASFHVLIVSGSRLGRLGNIQKKVWINTKELWRDTMYRMR